MRTVPAEIDDKGNIKLLEKLHCTSKQRVLVTVFDEGEDLAETALLSEPALAEDWSRPEEDVAWSYLRLPR